MHAKPIQTQLALKQPEDRSNYEVDVASPSMKKGITSTQASLTTEAPNTQEASSEIASATPAMKQYLQAKAEHPDCLMFYRMGDFYEMFFDDALIAAAALDIALTKRGKHADQEIPMCGVPAHAYEAYAEKLIRAGHRVAICEQMEDPQEAKKRGYKAIVNREVVRILTPGTLTEESLLDASESCHLAALSLTKTNAALAWVDCSTGTVHMSTFGVEHLGATLARINAKELLLPETCRTEEYTAFLRDWQRVIVYKPEHMFHQQRTERRVLDTYKIASLSPLGNAETAEIIALGVLLEYVSITQKTNMPRLDMPIRECATDVMQLDAATLRNLEITIRQNGEKRQSLLDAIDETVTASGSRLLASWLVAPLTKISAIQARQEVVTLMLRESTLRNHIRNVLKEAADSERALSRISLKRANPRDLLSVKHNLIAAREINGLLEAAKLAEKPMLLNNAWNDLRAHDGMIELLSNALKDDACGLTKDGNFIRVGFHAALDEYRNLREHGKQAIAELQARYARETSINTLKIKFNHVLGYFIEITQTNQHKVLDSFIHRQSLAGILRYTTPELGELATKISEAADRALKLEQEIFEQLSTRVLENQTNIVAAARALALIDVVTGLAELAHARNYVCPIVDENNQFIIENGRHPVVEQSLKKRSETFSGNDCRMDDTHHLWLITGPNMAGKSTYLRQNALIAILAQMGSFVPASHAKIGVIDKLFSRVGAADDLARGQSTFMVEMAETALILHQATSRSFVILDEIGRGTATYDGLSIARAVVEYIHNHIQCRTLFATHYHELTTLQSSLSKLACYQLLVKEWNNTLVFLHQVSEGASNRSYGIHVANLAGLPREVISNAERYLKELESKPPSVTAQNHPTEHQVVPIKNTVLEQQLAAINPDELSPKEALEILYKLKKL